MCVSFQYLMFFIPTGPGRPLSIKGEINNIPAWGKKRDFGHSES